MLRAARWFAAARPGTGVVAVSGGADSVALLRALHACGPALVVAHVNHRLRGPESDGDEVFVRELCALLDVGCHIRTADVATLATGANLESTARRVRYAFFAEVAQETGAAWVATAHTADDQAETVLHRLVRGTGLQGLRGIAAERPALPERSDADPPLDALPKTGRRESTLVRPLIRVTRADVLAYLAEINQAHRTDSTNADTRFTRNRIRHELLPLLKTFNPDVVTALTRLAEHANEAHEIVTAAAAELLNRAERPRAARAIVLDTDALATAPRGVARAALRLVWEREGWPMSDMTFDAWERAVGVACRNAPACDFPGGVRVRRAGRVVQLARKD